MAYKSFSQELMLKIERALKLELSSENSSAKKPEKKSVAVFDADGTLWDTDIGENFFRWQIKNNVVPLPPDPWRFYRDWKESGDPRPAYLWLAEINAGQRIETVQKWAEAAVAELSPLPIFQSQKDIIDLFHSNGVQVYVVTASVKWSVEPAAKVFGIPPARVIGVNTKVLNGIVTKEQDGEITYKAGKYTKLLSITGGVRPFFASGNSMGDITLLENASQCSLAVRCVPREHELWQTEEDLQNSAQKNGWDSHHF